MNISVNTRYYMLNFDIKVELYPDYTNVDIAASKGEMISDVKEEVNPQALADYLAFVDEAKSILEDYDLMILEKSNSKSSDTSKYFTLADLEQNVIGTMKFVIFLRISNHEPTDDPETLEWIRQKREHTKEKYNVKWKVRNIIVNKKEFSDYDEAIDYIEECAEKYSNTLKRRPKNN